MKHIINRLLNAVVLSLMATSGFLGIGMAMHFNGNAELFDILKIVGVMFLLLSFVFSVLFFTDKKLDFISKNPGGME